MFKIRQTLGPFFAGWAFLLLLVVTAVSTRFWQLGEIPPGLYQDEAYNGLDALRVIQGEWRLFFTANNGREPLYIYLTALAITLFGPSVWAVRLAAAVIGTLTTWATYQLAASWFDRRTGLLAAWLWIATLWPLHLSRIGLRIILLPFFLALFFWIGREAYRRQERRLWLLAGALYGAAFYTYLAIRFTPILLLLILVYLLLLGHGRRLWPGAGWFALAAVIVVAPLALLAWQQPDMILSRSGQVSILNPAVHGGHFWRTLGQHTVRALAMFLGQGDNILRHNPAGRPVFDWFMLGPFLVGVVYCLRHWRRPAAMALLLWSATMLGPTILAEDTPHFLRAAGVLPAVLLLPALGLSQLWTWTKLPCHLRQALVMILMLASLVLTGRDYLVYGRQADTAYLFETAVRDMAEQINSEVTGTVVYIEDERFWQKWPSLQFLIQSNQSFFRFGPEEGLSNMPEAPVAIYVWPFQSLDFVAAAVTPPALISVATGSLHRGDLEQQAYPLYVRYGVQRIETHWPVIVNFARQVQLHQVDTSFISDNTLQVDLYWSTGTGLDQPVVVFIHVVGPDGIIAQEDKPPGQGYWSSEWWQPGLIIHDKYLIALPETYDPLRQQILMGLYNANTQIRLPVINEAGNEAGDFWQLYP
jgi:4-amino-4-deoxy-L-arabinose transferase-like glycosyltransferase